MNKLSLSELGRIYVKRDGLYGEQLVVQGRYTRNASDTQAKITVESYLLTEDSDYLTTEDGDRIVISTKETPTFLSSMQTVDLNYGNNVYNKISVRAYPRTLDTTPQVLFTLNSPLQISASEVIDNVKVTYRDPSGTATRVNGKDMITPVSGTDYAMFSNSDGTGTNLTANLTVDVTYTSDSATYTLTNTGGSPGWITLLQARGTGIYTFDPVIYTAKDTPSI